MVWMWPASVEAAYVSGVAPAMPPVVWQVMHLEWMTAEECVAVGLALEVVPDDDLLEYVRPKPANWPLCL